MEERCVNSPGPGPSLSTPWLPLSFTSCSHGAQSRAGGGTGRTGPSPWGGGEGREWGRETWPPVAELPRVRMSVWSLQPSRCPPDPPVFYSPSFFSVSRLEDMSASDSRQVKTQHSKHDQSTTITAGFTSRFGNHAHVAFMSHRF